MPTRSFASRFDSGSSMRYAAGSRTIARPIATRCRCPPESARGRRASIRSSVVLPQPDGPTRTMNSPLSIARLTSSTATTPPGKTLLTPSKTIRLTVRQDNPRMTRITAVDAVDVRFPTSRSLDGSDAMNPAPDYSAAYAIVHAVWDLYAKREGKPLWKLLIDLSPEEVVACLDFRYISDALAPEEALELLRRNAPTKHDRAAEMLRDGFPAYTTSVGWLGYPDEKVRRLARDAVAAGWTHFKMKVGASLEDDVRRAELL